MTKTLQIFNILCLQRVFVIARLAREYVKNFLFADGKPKQTKNSLRVNACKLLRCIEILKYKSATQPKLNSKKDAKYIKINNSKLRIELLSIGCYLLSSSAAADRGLGLIQRHIQLAQKFIQLISRIIFERDRTIVILTMLQLYPGTEMGC